MDTIQRLTELFKQFPGIGPRQAKRFVYFLLTQPKNYSVEISRLITELKNEVVSCEMCFRFFPHHESGHICPICANTHREEGSLMIVSRDVDFENIEKSKAFNGYYFILGGSVPILEQEPEKKIRQKELLEVVLKRASSGLKEIIIALDYNPEGENTTDYIVKILEPIQKQHNLTISVLGRGLSTGSELEYADTDTLKNALTNRR